MLLILSFYIRTEPRRPLLIQPSPRKAIPFIPSPIPYGIRTDLNKSISYCPILSTLEYFRQHKKNPISLPPFQECRILYTICHIYQE